MARIEPEPALGGRRQEGGVARARRGGGPPPLVLRQREDAVVDAPTAERAARGARDARPYPWGDLTVDDSRAIYGRATYGPDPVGSRPLGASPDGVLGVVGNVWEWCRDRYDPQAYQQLPSANPCAAMTTDARVRAVKRGGSWTNSASSIRVSKRGAELLRTRRNNLGFRCAGN